MTSPILSPPRREPPRATTAPDAATYRDYLRRHAPPPLDRVERLLRAMTLLVCAVRR